jgi:hypothetical protein
MVDGLDWLLRVVEDGEVDPGEVGTEPRVPDDVRRLEDAIVLEERQSAPHADDAGNAFDAGGGEIFGLHAGDRRAWDRSFGRILRPMGLRTVSTR